MPDEVISIDPGGSNGWARWHDCVLVEFGVCQWRDEFCDWLGQQSPKIFVYERYLIDNRQGKDEDGFNHQWNKGITLQAIGAINYRANEVDALTVEQDRSIKPQAYAHMGATYVKGKKDMHHMDAIAHGHEFFWKAGLIVGDTNVTLNTSQGDPSGKRRITTDRPY